MKTPKPFLAAFTLIEMLIVVAIIVILAGLLLTVGTQVKVKQAKSLAYTELSQIETAIEAYKSKLGYYPPGNSSNIVVNALYFELEGCLFTNDSARGGPLFVTIDGSAWATTNEVWTAFGVGGIANSATTTKGTDESPAATQFIKNLKPAQYDSTTNAPYIAPNGRILVCSVDGSHWKYNSSNPTNNPGKYDLWVDLPLQGQTNRISNWSKTPQIVP